MSDWEFYGRRMELRNLSDILRRDRWFFVKITGRRRIGKTTLVRQALEGFTDDRRVFYVQVPDSGDPGVISAVNDALEIFQVPAERFPRPRNLADLVHLIDSMVRDGYIVVLDEFQYFNRKPFVEFCSLLQASVDDLSANAKNIHGGLIVLGSIHTEMAALLEDRSAPLYNRVTDSLELTHLDLAAVVAILKDHAEADPQRLLFLWSMFEGVPKYYRDCFEQGMLGADRRTLLRRIYFESSSPLRTEAENWYLRELKGRYDTVLKFVARNPGRKHKDLVQAIREVSGNNTNQIGGYLKTLTERYRLIERKLPVFAPPEAKRSRYYLSDNFLQAWLAALANPVAARDFRPVDVLVAEADDRLAEVEGFALERLVGQLYEERSRKGIADYPITSRIKGYWDRHNTEIDLVAINEETRRLRFGSCKRSASRLLADLNSFRGHVDRFLDAFPKYRAWEVEHVGISPRLGPEQRAVLIRHDVIPQDLDDLTAELR